MRVAVSRGLANKIRQPEQRPARITHMETALLPITMQMEIDLSAQAHQQEIAEGFAKLRAELLSPQPAPEPDQWRALMLSTQNALANDPYASIRQVQMMGGYWSPLANALVNHHNQGVGGMYALSGQLFGPRLF